MNKSGTADQVIALPKGGGAIKGLGETFSPDFPATRRSAFRSTTIPGTCFYGRRSLADRGNGVAHNHKEKPKSCAELSRTQDRVRFSMSPAPLWVLHSPQGACPNRFT
jgi:hypothetical protein